jgi:hypothetical protein
VLDVTPARPEGLAAGVLMNLAHFHIVVNHIPSLGSILGLLLLALGIYKKDETIKQSAYFVLVLITMAVLPTYVSGAEAQRIVKTSASYSAGMVQLHQNLAMVTLLAMTFAGMFAWFGAWEIRRHKRSASFTTAATLILTTAAVVLVLDTASIGGKINHSEIREASDAAVTEAVGWRASIESWVGAKAWCWPTLEVVHYVGMALLFGVALIFLFRMLGIIKGISFRALHRLMPAGIIGFVINVITGMIFFAAAPQLYVGHIGFRIKVVGILLTTAPILYFTMFDAPWKLGADDNPPVTMKIAAVAMFLLTVVVMFYGRFLFIL